MKTPEKVFHNNTLSGCIHQSKKCSVILATKQNLKPKQSRLANLISIMSDTSRLGNFLAPDVDISLFGEIQAEFDINNKFPKKNPKIPIALF